MQPTCNTMGRKIPRKEAVLRTSACRFALALLVLCAASPSFAWGQRAYEPPISKERGLVLYVVQQDGTFVQTMEDATRIKTPQGVEGSGTGQISYISSQEAIDSIEAWTVQPDGTTIPVPPDSIRDREEDNEAGAAEFSDTRYKIIIYPKVQVGSLVSYKVRSHRSVSPYPGEFTESFVFSARVPWDLWEVRFVLPVGKTLYFQSRGVTGGFEKTVDGLSHYTFRLQRGTVTAPEREAVGAMHYSDFLLVSTMPDMTALGKAAHAFFHPAVEITDDIRRLALKLTEGKAGDRAKVEALYLWVAQNIRYVSVALGSGRLVPHKASEVLRNLYGDCKDHVVLLESLLSAVGIESSPALINAGSTYVFPQIGSHYPINHVITYIPSLDLYLDSTDRFTPFGSLPFSVLDKPVTLTALGKTAKTPRMLAKANTMKVMVTMNIQPDGSVKGRSSTSMSGVTERNSRTTQFYKKGQPEETVVKDLLFRFNETGTGSISHPDPENLEIPYWVRGKFHLEAVVNLPGRGAMTVPVGVAPGDIAWAASDRPLSAPNLPFLCRSRMLEEHYRIQFPPSVAIEEIPSGATYRDSTIRYESRFRREGPVVLVDRKLVVQRTAAFCNAKDNQQWQAFYKVVQRDLRAQIFFR